MMLTLKSLTGRGVSAHFGEDETLIGKAEMFGIDGIAPLSPQTKDANETLGVTEAAQIDIDEAWGWTCPVKVERCWLS